MRTKDYDAIVDALATARKNCVKSMENGERIPKLAGWYITVSHITCALSASYAEFSRRDFYTAIGYYRGMRP